MQDWIGVEMAGLDLGDQRLNARQCLLLERFCANPQGSIPESSRGWTETQAAYRFFNNEKVTAASVLKPHRQATIERICQNDVVLILQDTTEVELDRSPEGGFGKLTYERRRPWNFAYSSSHRLRTLSNGFSCRPARETLPTFQSPGLRHFEIAPGGKAQHAEITVDDIEHRVLIYVYWS